MFPSDKVQALAYASGSKQLLSGSDEAILGIWNMDVKRIEVRKFIACNCLSQQEKLSQRVFLIQTYLINKNQFQSLFFTAKEQF